MITDYPDCIIKTKDEDMMVEMFLKRLHEEKLLHRLCFLLLDKHVNSFISYVQLEDHVLLDFLIINERYIPKECSYILI